MNAGPLIWTGGLRSRAPLWGQRTTDRCATDEETTMFEVSVEYSFAAGHALRGYKGKCENVHGHNYKVRVTVAGHHLNPAGLLMDFAELRASIKRLGEVLDHRFLNEISPFDQVNPSAENIAKYFCEGLEAPI